MRFLLPVAAAVVLTAVAAISMARSQEQAGGIAVLSAWARATPPGASIGAGYLTLENRGAEEDRLVAASSPAAASVVAHQTTEIDGIAQMRALEALAIAPGETLALEPGAAHLMLMDLSAPLTEGETVPVTLTFEKGGAVTVDLTVAPIGSSGPTEMHDHAHGH